MAPNRTTAIARITALLALALALTTFSVPARAAILTPLGSEAFTNQFEANTTGSPDFTPTDVFATGPTSSGGILSYSTGSATLGWFNSTLATPFSKAVGWTVEIRVKIDASMFEGFESESGYSITPGTPYGAMMLVVADDVGGYSVLHIGKNHVDMATSLNLSTATNTDDFHIFRVAKEADATVWSVWRDGVLLSSTVGISGAGTNTFYFGDGTSGDNMRGGAFIDYVRWTEGAFTVPEPASMSLVGLGGLLALRRRRRA